MAMSNFDPNSLNPSQIVKLSNNEIEIRTLSLAAAKAEFKQVLVTRGQYLDNEGDRVWMIYADKENPSSYVVYYSQAKAYSWGEIIELHLCYKEGRGWTINQSTQAPVPTQAWNELVQFLERPLNLNVAKCLNTLPVARCLNTPPEVSLTTMPSVSIKDLDNNNSEVPKAAKAGVYEKDLDNNNNSVSDVDETDSDNNNSAVSKAENDEPSIEIPVLSFVERSKRFKEFKQRTALNLDTNRLWLLQPHEGSIEGVYRIHSVLHWWTNMETWADTITVGYVNGKWKQGAISEPGFKLTAQTLDQLYAFLKKISPKLTQAACINKKLRPRQFDEMETSLSESVSNLRLNQVSSAFFPATNNNSRDHNNSSKFSGPRFPGSK